VCDWLPPQRFGWRRPTRGRFAASSHAYTLMLGVAIKDGVVLAQPRACEFARACELYWLPDHEPQVLVNPPLAAQLQFFQFATSLDVWQESRCTANPLVQSACRRVE